MSTHEVHKQRMVTTCKNVVSQKLCPARVGREIYASREDTLDDSGVRGEVVEVVQRGGHPAGTSRLQPCVYRQSARLLMSGYTVGRRD